MIYQYQCTKCNQITEAWRSVAERNNVPGCSNCGGKTGKIYIIPMANTGKGDNIPGVCHSLPGDSVYVKNKQHFRELCKQRNAGTPVNL